MDLVDGSQRRWLTGGRGKSDGGRWQRAGRSAAVAQGPPPPGAPFVSQELSAYPVGA